jgi:hypothetical protein
MKQAADFRALQAADEAAHEAAKKMIDSIQSQDWGKATEAFVAADKAIGTMIKSAAALLNTYEKASAAALAGGLHLPEAGSDHNRRS